MSVSMSWNPLLRLHFWLSGTIRTHVTIVVVFILLALAGALLSYRSASPAEHGSVSAFWLGITTAAQAFFLFLLGPGAVRKSVLRDFQTGMIESHRLSPMSSTKIVLGYMTGPPVQAFLLYATSLLIGSFFCAHYANSLGTPLALSGWYIGQIVLLTQALAIAALTLIIALGSAGKTNVLGVMILIGVFGGWVLLTLVPGLALLFGVLSASSVYNIVTSASPSTDSSAVAIAPVFQLIFAGICLRACITKIRTPDGPPFTALLGLLLTSFWAIVAITGCALSAGHPWMFEDTQDFAQALVSAASVLVVAQFALTGVAHELSVVDRRAALGAPLKSIRAVLLMVPLLCGLLAVGTLYALLYRLDFGVSSAARSALSYLWQTPTAMIPVALALVLSCVLDTALVYSRAARGQKLWWGSVIALVIKFAPLLIDAIVNITAFESGARNDYQFGIASAISPIGVVLVAHQTGLFWSGLAIQTLLTALFVALAFNARQQLLNGGGTDAPARSPVSARPATTA